MKMLCPTLAISIFAASFSLLLPQWVGAATIYSEAVSGDLPGDQSNPKLIGVLVAGTNTVIGHDSLNSDGGGGQGDTFGLTLGANQNITSILLTITNNTNTSDTFGPRIFESPYTQVQALTEPGGTTGAIPFTPFASQPPGQYDFSTQFQTGNQPSLGFDWQWNIQVSSAAPEPGSLALLGLGMGAVGLATRKRWRRRVDSN